MQQKRKKTNNNPINFEVVMEDIDATFSGCNFSVLILFFRSFRSLAHKY